MYPDSDSGLAPDLAALIAGNDDDALRAALAQAGPEVLATTLASLPMARANHVLAHVDGKTLAAALELGRKPPVSETVATGPRSIPFCVRAMDFAGKLLGTWEVEGKD